MFFNVGDLVRSENFWINEVFDLDKYICSNVFFIFYFKYVEIY